MIISRSSTVCQVDLRWNSSTSAVDRLNKFQANENATGADQALLQCGNSFRRAYGIFTETDAMRGADTSTQKATKTFCFRGQCLICVCNCTEAVVQIVWPLGSTSAYTKLSSIFTRVVSTTHLRYDGCNVNCLSLSITC